MNNTATTNKHKSSDARFLLLSFCSTVFCIGGAGGLLILFLFRTGMMNQLSGMAPAPTVEISPTPTQAVIQAPSTLPALPTEVNMPLPQETVPAPTLSAASMEEMNALLAQGKSLMEQDRCQEALGIWNMVVARFPGESAGYFERASCYYKLSQSEHSLQMAETYNAYALAEIDHAISLQPDLGDYYALRHDVLTGFAGNETYRIDSQAITRIARENARAAIALGYSDAFRFTDRVYAGDFLMLEECEQGLAETDRLLAITAPSDPTITGLYRMKAEANACLGDYNGAVEGMTASLQNPLNAVQKTHTKALFLYQAGRLEEALDVLNESLEAQPDFYGYRYYLRALIYYDLDRKDLARADLEVGSGYTWGRAQLFAYVLGKLTLDEGQREEGIELLQLAEASLDYQHMLIRSRIKEELAQLGAEPLSLTPAITLVSTQIPVHPPE